MNRKETALQRFSQGYNCAQSVFTVFATECGLDLETARQIAAIFGGGIARSGELCGAINGGFMALGLHLATYDPTDSKSKDHLYQLGQNFIERFRERFGEQHCRNLINRELYTPQMYHAARDNGIFQSQCPQCLAFAIETIEEIIDHNGREKQE